MRCGDGTGVGEPGADEDAAPQTFGCEPGWHDLDRGPLTDRSRATVTWTGTEVIVLGGENNHDGAAYDPSTRQWRMIAEPPLVDGVPLAAWTGPGLYVVGPDPDPAVVGFGARWVAAHDPAADTWRQLAGVDPAAAHRVADDDPRTSSRSARSRR